MKTQEILLNNLSDHYVGILSRKVIRQIQHLPKAAMLSGDDSPLKNVWDEVCVQVQDEKFDAWDLTEDMIRSICNDIIDDLPNEIQHLLSYAACMENEVDYEDSTFYKDDVTELLYDKVISLAMNYRNQKIEYYLERGYGYDY